jgi:hypothetical protein
MKNDVVKLYGLRAEHPVEAEGCDRSSDRARAPLKPRRLKYAPRR